MYHGIIQESNWTRKGTYLRKKIEQYGFDKVINHGRIWRLVHDSKKPDFTRPNMHDGDAGAAGRLPVARRTAGGATRAQRILVLRQDASVAPALTELAKTGSSLVGRFHALWTLEGLGKLDAALVRELLKDVSPQMRVQAIRVSESLVKAGDASFDADVRARLKDGDASVILQALLTLNLHSRLKNGTDDAARIAEMTKVVEGAQAATKAHGVKEIGDQLIRPAQFTGGGGGFRLMAPEQLATLKKGEGIYTELCFSCHGADGNGEPLAGAPAGHDDGAAAGRLAARHRAQGLRDPDRAARADRSGRRLDLLERDDPDERQRRRVDRVDRLVRPQQLRQPGVVRVGGRRRAGPRQDQGPRRASGRSRSSRRRCRARSCRTPAGRRWPATMPGNALRAVGGLTPPGGRPATGAWSTGARQQAGHVADDRHGRAGHRRRDPLRLAGGVRRPGPAAGPGGPPEPGGPGRDPAARPAAPGAAGAWRARRPRAGAPRLRRWPGRRGAPGAPRRAGGPSAAGAVRRRASRRIRAPTRSTSRSTARSGACRWRAARAPPGSTTIVLERPVRARYIRITQTGTEETRRPGAVARLQVYGPPSPASPAARPSAP